jgi:hypothetical protein
VNGPASLGCEKCNPVTACPESGVLNVLGFRSLFIYQKHVSIFWTSNFTKKIRMSYTKPINKDSIVRTHQCFDYWWWGSLSSRCSHRDGQESYWFCIIWLYVTILPLGFLAKWNKRTNNKRKNKVTYNKKMKTIPLPQIKVIIKRWTNNIHVYIVIFSIFNINLFKNK